MYLWILREDVVHQAFVARHQVMPAAEAVVAVGRHRTARGGECRRARVLIFAVSFRLAHIGAS